MSFMRTRRKSNSSHPAVAMADAIDQITRVRRPTFAHSSNKAGLDDALAVVRYEAAITAVTIPYAIVRLRNNRRTWGLKHWRIAHRTIFEPIYDWAGKLRTTNIRKLDTTFADKQLIQKKIKAIFARLYAEHAPDGDLSRALTLMPKHGLAHLFAELYRDLHLVHPFPEGNSRSQMVLLTAMAWQSGYDLKWNSNAPCAATFNRALAEGVKKNDLTRLAHLFDVYLNAFTQEALASHQIRRQCREAGPALGI